MRRPTRPPVSSSTRGASRSHIELMALAPMASRTSARRCTTSMAPQGSSSPGKRWRTSSPRAPPPAARRLAWAFSASASSSSFASQQRPLGRLGVGHLEHLDLPDHHGLAHVGPDAAARAQELRREAARRQHRGLLDRHGDERVLSVYAQVHAEPERQSEDADRVLDHPIGLPLAQPGVGREERQVRVREGRDVAELFAPRREGEAVEAGDRAVHRTASVSGRPARPPEVAPRCAAPAVVRGQSACTCSSPGWARHASE